MPIRTLLKLMDVKTLVAGVIPVTMGSIYSLYRYGKMSILDMLVILFGIMLVQSCANMVNDYFDYKRGSDKLDKAHEKALAAGQVTAKQVILTVVVFLTIDFAIAGYYAIRNHPLIMIIAIVGTLILYFYSAGSRPISHTSFGEFVAGTTMGLGIMGTVIYIQSGHVNLETLVVTLPTAIYIGTILLTNNISDHMEDREVGRVTLPIRIGINLAEVLWVLSCHSLLTITAVFVIVGYYPVLTLLLAVVAFPYIPVYKFRTVQKVRKNKGYLMGLIGGIGLRYHISIMIGLMIAYLLG